MTGVQTCALPIYEAVRQLEVILEAAKAMPKYMKDFIDEVNNNA